MAEKVHYSHSFMLIGDLLGLRLPGYIDQVMKHIANDNLCKYHSDKRLKLGSKDTAQGIIELKLFEHGSEPAASHQSPVTLHRDSPEISEHTRNTWSSS